MFRLVLAIFLAAIASLALGARTDDQILELKKLASNAFNGGNYDLAKKYLWALADEGDAYGEYGLALIYRSGWGSTPKDVEHAVYWCIKAANKDTQDAAVAMHDAAVMLHELGRVEEAYGWLHQAARWGNDDAVELLQQLGRSVPEADLLYQERVRQAEARKAEERAAKERMAAMEAEIRKLERESASMQATASLGRSLGCALAGGCGAVPVAPAPTYGSAPSSRNRSESGYSSVYESDDEGCTSDYSCGTGYSCVKQPYRNSGVCMRSVDENGLRSYRAPSVESFGPNTNAQCSGSADCPTGFRCDLRYQACVR